MAADWKVLFRARSLDDGWFHSVQGVESHSSMNRRVANSRLTSSPQLMRTVRNLSVHSAKMYIAVSLD